MSGQGLPPDVQAALERLTRFEHLEIAGKKAPAPPPATERRLSRLCLSCGQANEPERAVCWACSKRLDEPKPAAPQQEVTLVLDGETYRSTDPALPEDIQDLIGRIRGRGYSPELVAEWRSWRATRRTRSAREAGVLDERRGQDDDADVRVFRGQRVSVIRLDGKIYTSDDPGLSDEMQVLFHYIEEHGVTPELMDTLRARGRKVRFRPATIGAPSDGDLAFWDAAAKAQPNSLQARAADRLSEARREIEAQGDRRRKLAAAVGAALFVLIVKLANC